VAGADYRASDADRERTAQQLREHFAAGRLTEEEMTERVSAAYAARTQGDLSVLLGDLPLLPATSAERRAELVARRRHLQRRLLQQTGGGIALVVVCVAIWLGDGARGQFWPVWVMLIVLLPLIRNGWRLYGPAPELERVEAELARRERRRRHHHHGH
jgi:Domain of unknown function (DUF1707)